MVNKLQSEPSYYTDGKENIMSLKRVKQYKIACVPSLNYVKQIIIETYVDIKTGNMKINYLHAAMTLQVVSKIL